MHPSPVARLFDEQPLHPEADRSPTLAARHYVDPGIFEAEKEAIFYRSWQFAAHRSQLDAPGKFVTWSTRPCVPAIPDTDRSAPPARGGTLRTSSHDGRCDD